LPLPLTATPAGSFDYGLYNEAKRLSVSVAQSCRHKSAPNNWKFLIILGDLVVSIPIMSYFFVHTFSLEVASLPFVFDILPAS